MGIRFRKNARVRYHDGSVVGDIVFARKKVVVFLDGCFWHRCPAHGTAPNKNADYWRTKLDLNVRRDVEVNAALRAEGWTVIRLWEHVPPEQAAERIAASLESWGRC
jgi:DNA mismatch endonuclease (patch repair protein)